MIVTQDQVICYQKFMEKIYVFSGVPYVILRLHNVYGPRMGMRHVIPELIKKDKKK